MNQAREFLGLARMGRNEGWRYAATLLLVLMVFVISSVIFAFVLVFITRGSPDLSLVPPPVMLVAAAVPFAGLLLVLWIGVRFLHERPFRSLITPLVRPRWSRALAAGLIWTGLAAAGDLVTAALVMPGNYVFQFDAGAFVPYALLVLLLIPIQASTEELLFRGYLMQGIGLLSRGTLALPLVITSVIFGLMHSLNTEVATYGIGIMMVYYMGFGLFLGWLTLATGGLEAAIGLHVANNIYSTLAVTFPGSSLPAPALFRVMTYDPIVGLVILAASAVVFLGIFWAMGWLGKRNGEPVPVGSEE